MIRLKKQGWLMVIIFYSTINNRNACKHYFQDFICLFVNADLTFELMQVRLLLPMMHAYYC